MHIGGLENEEVYELVDNLLAHNSKSRRELNDPAFPKLLSLLRGHPLCLRTILPLLEHHKPKFIAEKINGHTTLSQQGGVEDFELIDASITYSISRIDHESRFRVALLSLFSSVVNTEVLGRSSKQKDMPKQWSELTSQDWNVFLEKMSELGLLSSLGIGCFQMHPALSSHFSRTWQMLAGGEFTNQRRAAETAVIEGVAEYGQALQIEISNRRTELALTLVHYQLQDLTGVLEMALDRKMFRAAQMIMEPLVVYWQMRGSLGEVEHWITQVRSEVEVNDKLVADIDSDAGSLWMFVISIKAGRLLDLRYFDEAEAIYLELSQKLKRSKAETKKHNLARCYFQFGRVAQDRNDLDRAEARYYEALDIQKELNHRPGMILTYFQLGQNCWNPEDASQAELFFRKSSAIAEEDGDQHAIANACHELSIIEEHRENFNEAEELIKKSQAINERFGNLDGIATNYHQQGHNSRDTTTLY